MILTGGSKHSVLKGIIDFFLRFQLNFIHENDNLIAESLPTENLNRLSYSAFVPTDEALKKSLKVENLVALDRKSINDFLLEHVVPGYLFEEDFEDGFNLLSLTHKAIPIKIVNGKDLPHKIVGFLTFFIFKRSLKTTSRRWF